MTAIISGRWRALVLIAAAQVGAMSTWFSAAAVMATLSREWHLSPSALALLTVAVQLGFVAGGLVVAVSGIADVLSLRRVFVVSALGASLANALLPLAAGKMPSAIALRFALGFLLAGVYPVGMKLMTGWFRSDRGLAIGTLVGALTLGAAVPHMLVGLGISATLPWTYVIWGTSGAALTSALIIGAFVRPGPFESRSGRLDLGWAIRSFRQPALRLANFGYFGHMWELYAMWTWLPAFLLASLRTASPLTSETVLTTWASLGAAGAIAAGALGCVGAGIVADRIGRTRVTSGAMLASAGCTILAATFFGAAPTVVMSIAVLWGFSVIADSAQFSSAVSELADPSRTGSALALQTALGFLLTVVTVQLVPLVQEAVGWRGAMLLLSPGPLLGSAAMARLRRRPEAARIGGERR